MSEQTPDTTRRRRRQEISDSLLDKGLGRFGGWQMALGPGESAKRMVEIRNAGGVVVHRVDGAVLGADEADVLTWVMARWARTGASADGVVRTTLYEMTRALYGERRIGGRDVKRVSKAIDNLFWASITVTDFAEPAANGDGEALPTLFSDRRLVVQVDYGAELKRLRDGESVEAHVIGGLRDETLVLHLAPWLIKRLEEDRLRAWLDWPVQRALGAGMGKRLWFYIESMPGYEPLPDAPEYEMAVLDLAEDVYAELGANCKERWDNRKSVRRGMARVLEEDQRYVALLPDSNIGCELIVGRGMTPDRLRVVRKRRS